MFFTLLGFSTKDVELGGDVAPLPLEPAGSAACSSNGGCAALGLTQGDCCVLDVWRESHAETGQFQSHFDSFDMRNLNQKRHSISGTAVRLSFLWTASDQFEIEVTVLRSSLGVLLS